MPKRKEEEQFATLGEKDCWHTYSLQMLQPAHFSKVVSKILDGNYSLVVTRFDKTVTQKLN